MKIIPREISRKQAHDVLASTIIPRPIAFVGTMSRDGVYNCAPFSFFAPVSSEPMVLGFSTVWNRDGVKKDTLANIESTKEFTINVVDDAILHAMNKASGNYPPEVDEFEEAGLTPVTSDMVSAPRIGESKVCFECRLNGTMEFSSPKYTTTFIAGEVLLVHIDEEALTIDDCTVCGLRAIARLGADNYCGLGDVFELKRPDEVW